MVNQFMKYKSWSDTLQLLNEKKVWQNGQYEDLCDHELASTGKLLSLTVHQVFPHKSSCNKTICEELFRI